MQITLLSTIIISKRLEGIRNIMNNNNISHNVTQLSSNGRMIDDSKCIVNKLNNFFVNVGQTTEITIPKIPPDKNFSKKL